MIIHASALGSLRSFQGEFHKRPAITSRVAVLPGGRVTRVRGLGAGRALGLALARFVLMPVLLLCSVGLLPMARLFHSPDTLDTSRVSQQSACYQPAQKRSCGALQSFVHQPTCEHELCRNRKGEAHKLCQRVLKTTVLIHQNTASVHDQCWRAAVPAVFLRGYGVFHSPPMSKEREAPSSLLHELRGLADLGRVWSKNCGVFSLCVWKRFHTSTLQALCSRSLPR